MPKPRNSSPAFTLAELLIALAILGMIATFTIPKVLIAQTNSKYNAIAKEGAAMVSGAYQQYQAQTNVTSGVGIQDLTQFMNYVATDTSTTIDDRYTTTSYTCGVGTAGECLRLHNGAMLRYGKNTSYNFGGTNSTNYVWFDDPDSIYSGTTNGDGKAIEFCIYYNGRVSTRGIVSATPSLDPPWFNWSQ